MQPLLCSHLQLAEGRHSDNPTTIPITANFWSDNPGISGRFPSESVVGFFRNHWSDNVGILIFIFYFYLPACRKKKRNG